MPKRILLASHGSQGALAAEQHALAVSTAGDYLDHLYVIPAWWGGMTGDDWLNNAVSRDRFCNYLSTELQHECELTLQRVKHQCEEIAVSYQPILRVGDSDKELNKQVHINHYDQVFIGCRRAKHIKGLQDVMLSKKNINKIGHLLSIVSPSNG